MDSPPRQPSRPRSRGDFEIAIICALTIESDAVEALFDGFWEGRNSYGKAPGDPNAYTLGWIDHFNVVLVHMPGMGKTAAASVTASFRSSFPNVKLGLLVGICGGVPTTFDKREIFLGDVAISTGIVQYDFTRQFPDEAVRKDTLEDNLGRPNSEIRAFLGKLKGHRSLQLLMNHAWMHLKSLEERINLKARYPGVVKDLLFESNYQYKHQHPELCSICASSKMNNNEVCKDSRELSCDDLGCSKVHLVNRTEQRSARRTQSQDPADTVNNKGPYVFFGRIASGDVIMKSGQHRDSLSTQEKVIAFEMEGAGMWDNFPTIIIKGVCDYADSHKNKKWQSYAAASAAAFMKALLHQWRARDTTFPPSKWINTIPTNAISNFIGRHALLDKIDASLFGAPNEDNRTQVIVLLAMGGQGKTQLALKVCKRAQNTHEGIFWVSAKSRQTAEKAFESLADELNVTGRVLDDTASKVKFVFNYLQSWDQKWVLVLDNYDEVEKFKDIRDFMPSNPIGTIIVTSRNESASRLGRVLAVPSMIEDQGEEILLRSYWNRQGDSDEMLEATKIVDRLGGLALALDQAASYINFTRMMLSDFASKYELKKREIMEYRPDLFEYHSESGEPLSVFTTWEMSLDHFGYKNKERRKNIEDFLAVSACMDTRNIFEDIFTAYEVSYDDHVPWMQLFTRQHNHPVSKIELVPSKAPDETPKTRWENLKSTMRHLLGNDYKEPTSRNDDSNVAVPFNETWSSDSFQHVISELKKVGLLRDASEVGSNDGTTFSMHPVIEDWLQRRILDPDHQETIMRQCLKILVAAVDAHPVDICAPQKRKWLLAHIDACILSQKSVGVNLGIGSINMKYESVSLGHFFREEGQLSKSAGILEKLLENARKAPKTKSKDLNSIMNHLSYTYGSLKRYKESELLDLEILERCENLLGAEHMETLESMEDLALTYYLQNRCAEAEVLAEQVLDIRKRKQGMHHRDTIYAMANVALIYQRQKRFQESVAMGRNALRLARQVLSEEDEVTVIFMSKIAFSCSERGLLEEAESLHMRTLDLRTRTRGRENPITITDMYHMVGIYDAQQRWQEAQILGEEVVELAKRVLGQEHPETLCYISKLANIYRSQGKLTEAEAIESTLV